jgi:1,2-dihydroxy-3-keto-5-methylthiopentene dioxygenase
MALVTIFDEDKRLSDEEAVTSCLKSYDVDYQRWIPAHPLAIDASAEEILRAYSAEIDTLKALGGYVTADIIDVSPETPGLEGMLAKFNREHWHDEDEVRFIISGHGLFHIHAENRSVVGIEVGAGDLIRVPRGTRHWFNLCSDLRIRAIRLFQDVAGWTPHYSESGVDDNFLPVCFGVSHLPYSSSTAPDFKNNI